MVGNRLSCNNAQCRTCSVHNCRMSPAQRLRADDLLVLLAVARTGRYTSAAAHLGLDHTTIARRIAALEEALGGRVVAQSAGGWELTELGRSAAETGGRIEAALSQLDSGAEAPDPVSGVVRMSATDGFSAYIAAPAISKLRESHPRLTVEIVAATRRAAEHRAGLDLEVVVGAPQTRRAHAVKLGSYTLGMYASRDYLERTGTPADAEELEQQHRLVYFVDSMLQVDALDLPRRLVPRMQDGLTSTNVFVHVEATRAGAGIGLLPCFAADRHPDLVRLLPSVFAEKLPYFMVARPESLRLPPVAALAEALRAQTRAAKPMLDGVSG